MNLYIFCIFIISQELYPCHVYKANEESQFYKFVSVKMNLSINPQSFVPHVKLYAAHTHIKTKDYLLENKTRMTTSIKVNFSAILYQQLILFSLGLIPKSDFEILFVNEVETEINFVLYKEKGIIKCPEISLGNFSHD